MSTGFLMYVALVLTLAAAMGWALETVLWQRGRPSRWAWLAASVAALVLITRAAIAISAEPATASYSRIALPATSKVASPEWSPLQVVRDALAKSAEAVGAVVDAVVRAIPGRLTSVVVALWVAASILAFMTLVLVHLRLRRSRRDWAETELFGTRVRIAPDIGPAVVGVVRPQIVVPHWLLTRSSDEQRLVLAHEREHLGARDHLLLGAGSLVVALVPWHPAAWWMLSRLRLAVELDCDARVLRRGVPARTYGTLLIDLADRCTGFRVGATALADEGSHLERRLLAMKSNSHKRSIVRAGALGAAAALALLAACEAKVPTGPEIEAMDVASASKAVAGTRMMEKSQLDSATFYVDGNLVDAKTANALTPSQIVTIDINKGGANPVIRIQTRDALQISGSRGEMQPERAKLSGNVEVQGSGKFAGLVYIDGVKSDPSAMQSLDRKKIESIEVLKGPAAEKAYTDPLAKNGVIVITTKK